MPALHGTGIFAVRASTASQTRFHLSPLTPSCYATALAKARAEHADDATLIEPLELAECTAALVSRPRGLSLPKEEFTSPSSLVRAAYSHSVISKSGGVRRTPQRRELRTPLGAPRP